MMAITSRMGITSRMPIIRGMDITGLFVVPGGKGADWSLVTTRIIGRLDIISTDRPLMATGEFGAGFSFHLSPRKACGSEGGRFGGIVRFTIPVGITVVARPVRNERSSAVCPDESLELRIHGHCSRTIAASSPHSASGFEHKGNRLTRPQ